MIGTTIPKHPHQPRTYTQAALWCAANNATISDQGDHYLIIPIPAPTLSQTKQTLIAKAQKTFAAKRDTIRWIRGCGFDCTPSDITTFMAAYTPLLIQGSGTAQYKVHLPDNTKALVDLTLDHMTEAYRTIRASQLDAYADYRRIHTEITNAQTQKQLTDLLNDPALTDPTETNNAQTADAQADNADSTHSAETAAADSTPSAEKVTLSEETARADSTPSAETAALSEETARKNHTGDPT